MPDQNHIVIQGLCQNNLKNISLKIPKQKLVVFTGVSGSGKSSIVFDTIAAESQRQMNETYSAYVRGRLPKYEKPKTERIENLSPSVIIDQTPLGGNARSTVGTISDMYSALRLLYSRIGEPYVGTPSCFSFNSPGGMCPECSGLGKVMTLDVLPLIKEDKSWNEGMVELPTFRVGNWYWKQYTDSGLFDLDKKWQDYSERERNLLLYGSEEPGGKRVSKQVEGIHNMMSRLLLKRDSSELGETSAGRLAKYVRESDCPLCHGKRLNGAALSCKIAGYDISKMCEMELTELKRVLGTVTDPRGRSVAESLVMTLTRMIEIGLPYLSLNREAATLSGGEAQRLKLVRYMGSALTGMLYIFDEPSTGMHPRDVHRMTRLLRALRDKGNTVLVVEHDKDVISIADEVIDVGPLAGKNGGEVLYQGSYQGLLPVKHASLHNLKQVSVDIPLRVLTAVTGVAGSGKSSLIRDVFAGQYPEQVILVDQSPVTATGRSTPATFLGFFDDIRKQMAKENNVSAALFSFNSKGACPVCKGRGAVTTELVFMDPVTTTCEACGGSRYSNEALSYLYKGKNIVEILDMSAEEAEGFFSGRPKICRALHAMVEVGLPYLSLGQPLSTLSGGERQWVKLAKYLGQKGNIYVLDEPTTGLHASDVKTIMKLLDGFVEQGNTVVVIEHNMDVVKLADYVIDMGPDGGTMGGEVVFTGTPQELAEYGQTITADYLRKC